MSFDVTHLQEHYQQQGYCILPEYIPDTLIQDVHHAIDRWIDAYQIQDNHAVFDIQPRYQSSEEELFLSAETVYGFLEKESVNQQGKLIVPKRHALNKIGHALHDLIPEVKKLAQHPLIAQCIQIANWQHASLIQSMVIFKSPKIGGEVPWHQDATYLSSSPQKVLGIWIALEDATIENGCLWMAPGQHRSPLREIYTIDAHTKTGMKHPLNSMPWPKEDQEVPLEVKSGSVVLFHDHMPHRSNMNRSERSRKALTFHCYDPQTQWQASNWLHRKNLDPFLIDPKNINLPIE